LDCLALSKDPQAEALMPRGTMDNGLLRFARLAIAAAPYPALA
jgi:hypothetical protein